MSCKKCEGDLSEIPNVLQDGSRVNDLFCKECGYTEKPYTHLDKIWMVLSVNPEDGAEGLLSMKGEDGRDMPLMAGDKDRLASITEAGKAIVAQSGLPKVRLVEFGSRRVVKEISEMETYSPEDKGFGKTKKMSLEETLDDLITEHIDSEGDSKKVSLNMSLFLTKTIMAMRLKIGKEKTKQFLDMQKGFLDVASDMMA